MRIEWRELIKRCPELASLADDARSVAEQECTAWYERWLPNIEHLCGSDTESGRATWR